MSEAKSLAKRYVWYEPHQQWLAGTGGQMADLRWAGLRKADLCGADLREANLSGADLSGADLSEADLSGANLSEVNLSGANLSGADLSEADLSGANLSGATLSKADSSERIPVVADLDAKILAALEGGGSLEMCYWHACSTTHCRAGWAITIAGDAGQQLEQQLGTSAAAALIYAVSRPGQRVPDWYATNEDALADIQLHARSSGGIS